LKQQNGKFVLLLFATDINWWMKAWASQKCGIGLFLNENELIFGDIGQRSCKIAYQWAIQ